MMLSILKNRVLITSVASFLSFSSLGLAVQLEFCRDAVQESAGNFPSKVAGEARTGLLYRISLKAQSICCEGHSLSLTSGDPYTNSTQRLQSSQVTLSVDRIGAAILALSHSSYTLVGPRSFVSRPPPLFGDGEINLLNSILLI